MRDTRRRLRESGGIDLDVQYVQIRRIYSGRLGGGGGGVGVVVWGYTAAGSLFKEVTAGSGSAPGARRDVRPRRRLRRSVRRPGVKRRAGRERFHSFLSGL